MAYLEAYDRLGRGFDLSYLSDGFGFVSTEDAPVYREISGKWLDYDTYQSLLYTPDSYAFAYQLMFIDDVGSGMILRDVDFFNENAKMTAEMYDLDLFISYDDLASGATDWFVDILNGNDWIIGNKYRDIIKGASGNDTLKGNGGNDKLYGEYDNDGLYGGNGNDKLFGGAGFDMLKGGKGNDKLYGEAGNDVLKGQGGADRFIFRDGYEQDLITDFSDKDDVLDLRSFDFSSVKEAKSYATMIDGDTVFDFGGGDLLFLEDFNMSSLDKGDFII